jgi:TolB protein
MKLRWIVGIIALIALAGVVSADSTTNKMVVDPAQGMPGDTVVIPIKMLNAVNLGNADLYFLSNGDNCEPVFTVISADTGSLTQGSLFDSRISNDAAAISFASSKGITGSGTIAIVTVKVKSNAQGLNGKNGCVFSVTGNYYDSEGKYTHVPDGGSTFTLAPALKGDGDQDGKVTTKDALTALQMAVGKIPQNMVYDINGDGYINSNDVREILKLSVVHLSVPQKPKSTEETDVVENIGGSLLAETPVSVKEVETGGSVQMRKL